MDATVAAVTEVGPDAVAIAFDTPEGFDARPGQFVKLTATVDGDPVSRFYTVSSPDTEGTFEATLTVDAEGDFTPYLAACEPGDVVGIEGPFGSAHYDDEPVTLVLAGGPGVGAALAIAERTLADGGETAVVYQDEQPIHAARLDALREAGATVMTLAPGDDLSGVTRQVVSGFDAAPAAFVYGFSEFVGSAVDALGAAGVEEDAAKIESFGPAPGGD